MSKLRALCIGINYTGESRLNGCINDAINMTKMLTARGYDCELMTDATDIKPTRANILDGIWRLISSDATNMFISYSGHGGRVKDYNEDESDSLDETICPLDYKTAGQILDDQLRAFCMLVDRGKTLTWLMDCCHSGTSIDLAFNLWERRGKFAMIREGDSALGGLLENPIPLPYVKTYPLTNANVFMISGSQDVQTSADALISGKYQGALTWSFLNSMGYADGFPKINPRPTWNSLMSAIYKNLKSKSFEQMPNFASGREISLSKKVSF